MKKMMFSHCDKGNDGTINKEEFKNAWEWLQDVLAERITIKMGVGYDAVIQTVMIVLLFMACFFLFLVYHLRVFVANGDFQSILTSLFVIGSGIVTKFFGKAAHGDYV